MSELLEADAGDLVLRLLILDESTKLLGMSIEDSSSEIRRHAQFRRWLDAGGSIFPGRFRWHRGALEDSLATLREVHDLDELVRVLNEDLVLGAVTAADVVIDFYGYDSRINCNLLMVRIRRPEHPELEGQMFVAGFIDIPAGE